MQCVLGKYLGGCFLSIYFIAGRDLLPAVSADDRQPPGVSRSAAAEK